MSYPSDDCAGFANGVKSRRRQRTGWTNPLYERDVGSYATHVMATQLPGIVRPTQQVTMAAAMEGTLMTLHVHEGQNVAKDTLLSHHGQSRCASFGQVGAACC